MKLGITEYNRIHKWAARHMMKQGKCFYCERKTKTVWSNIDHEYRQDKTEWQEICHKCHTAYDRQHLNMKLGRVRTKPRWADDTLIAPKDLARLKTYGWFDA